jgi:hypothetical protein
MAYKPSYQPIYGGSKYSLDILRPKTAKPRWYEMDPLQKRIELGAVQQKLSETPIVPEAAKEEARKPLRNALQVIGNTLNVPSAIISGAVKQLVDGIPGFDAQEYFNEVFTLKNRQASWSDIIEILAEKDENQNLFDKKWVQIVGGLTLDILLDPLAWFGAGALTKISGKAAEGVAKKVFTMLKKADPQVANRIYFNILNRGFKRVWGFQLPWRPTRTIKGIQGKVGKGISEILERASKLSDEALATGQIPELVRAMALGKKMTPIQKLTAWVGKTKVGTAFQSAFMPNRAIKQGPLFTKLTRQYEAKDSARRILQEIGGMRRENKLDHQTLRQLTDIIWTMPYVDDAVVRHQLEMANLTNKFIAKYIKGGDWEKVVEGLAKKNEMFLTYFDSRLRRAIEAKAAVGKKLKPSEIVDKMGDMYDKTSAIQLKTMLEGAGFRSATDLESLAKLEPKADLEEIFRRLGKELTLDQKKAIKTRIDFNRIILDNWFREEYAAGIPVKYKRDYISKMTGAARVVVKRPRLGARAAFTHRQWSKMSPVQRFDSWAQNLVDTGSARNLEHAGTLLREGKIEKLGKMVDTMDEALWIRGQAHVKAMHKVQIIDGLKQFGIQTKKQPGLSKLGDMIGIADDKFQGYVFDRETARYIKNLMPIINDDKGMAGFLKMIDKTQNWWKGMVTIMNPGFVFRNKISNNMIGVTRHGMVRWSNVRLHRQMRAAVLEALFPDNPQVWKFFSPWTNKKMLDQVVSGVPGMKVRDLIRPGVMEGMIRPGVRIVDDATKLGVSDLNKVKKKVLKLINPTTPEFAVAKVMEQYSGVIESHARMVSFALELQDMGSIHLAARKTQEIFVEYALKSDLERKIVSRVVPFWSWLKQNTANQVKFIFTMPGRYSKLPKFVNALEPDENKVPDEWKPEYFREMWAWQLPITLPDGTPLFFNPNFPFQDLNKLDPTVWERTLMTSITPFLKVPAELISRTEFYKKRPIERYPGYRAPIPGIVQNIVSALPGNMKRALDLEQDSYGNYVMNPFAAHVIKNLVPFVTNMSRMMMQEPVAIPADRYFRWLSYMLGVKIKPVDTLTQQYYHTQDVLRRRKELLKKYQ